MNRDATLTSRPGFGRARPWMIAPAPVQAPDADWLDDLKLFATGWVGGLVFFGTLIA